jgi:hypothetical protein
METLGPILISPQSGPSCPSSMRMKTDLPEPFGPISPTRSPCQMVSLIRSKMRRSPNDLETPSSSSTLFEPRQPFSRLRSMRRRSDNGFLDLVHLVQPLLHRLGFGGEIFVIVDLAPDGIALDGRLQPLDFLLLGAEHLLLARDAGFLVHHVKDE